MHDDNVTVVIGETPQRSTDRLNSQRTVGEGRLLSGVGDIGHVRSLSAASTPDLVDEAAFRDGVKPGKDRARTLPTKRRRGVEVNALREFFRIEMAPCSPQEVAIDVVVVAPKRCLGRITLCRFVAHEPPR